MREMGCFPGEDMSKGGKQMQYSEAVTMTENRYTLAGWLAITQAVMFPVAIGIGIMQSIIGARFFDYRGPIFGPTDIIMLAFTLIGIYVMLKFRSLLNERYDFHAIDTLIILSIIWAVVFEFVGLFLKYLAISMWRYNEIEIVIISIAYLSVSMITIGIIDILIAVQLMKKGKEFNSLIRAFSYITMAAGIMEVTVFLSPFSLLLVPVTLVTLGLIFFRDKEEVEFV